MRVAMLGIIGVAALTMGMIFATSARGSAVAEKFSNPGSTMFGDDSIARFSFERDAHKDVDQGHHYGQDEAHHHGRGWHHSHHRRGPKDGGPKDDGRNDDSPGSTPPPAPDVPGGPTGPAAVSDSGTTAALLGIAATSMLAFRRRVSSRG